jgi:peroxiredoxin
MNASQSPVPPADQPSPDFDPAPRPPETPPPSRAKWVIVGACAIALALFAVPLLRKQPAAPRADTPVATKGSASCPAAQGQAKLDFTVKDMDGRSVKLADYKGKVILLNFWATWCGPCKLEIPEFVQLYSEYKDKGFVILGMLTEDSPTHDELRAFVSEHKMNYPIMYSQDEIDEAFGPIYGIPTSFFIGRDGSICLKHMGPGTKLEFEEALKSLL